MVFWWFTSTFFSPMLNRSIRVCILGVQWPSWELFSAHVSDRNELSREMHICVHTTPGSINKCIFINIYINENDKFSLSEAKWTYFFINMANFNWYIKEMKKTLQKQLNNYKQWEWQKMANCSIKTQGHTCRCSTF